MLPNLIRHAHVKFAPLDFMKQNDKEMQVFLPKPNIPFKWKVLQTLPILTLMELSTFYFRNITDLDELLPNLLTNIPAILFSSSDVK